MLHNFPNQFNNFIKMCDGIDFDYNNCTINIKENKKESDLFSETIEEISLSENNSDKNIFCSYVKDTDFSELNDKINEIEEILKKDKAGFIRDYVNFVVTEDFVTLKEYLVKFNCTKPNNDVILAIKKDASDLYEENLETCNYLKKLQESYKLNQENNKFEGAVVLPGIDIIYNENCLKGGIHLPEGGIVLFNAIMNPDNSINAITLDNYEFLTDITSITDENILDYKKINNNTLAKESLFPIKSNTVPFNILLSGNNMEEFSKKPVAAIYKLKDELIKTVLTYTDSKNGATK